MLNPALRNQSLGRPLTGREAAFAAALEALFAGGMHAPETVAAALQARGIERPSGVAAPWDEAALRQELSVLNSALDDAYLKHGIGA